MKPSEAGLLLLSNCAFIGGVLAEALPRDGIPLQCATICGPMVELSAICSGGNSKDNSLLSKRRDTTHEKRKAAAEQRETTTRRPSDRGHLAKRDLTVIVVAPTSFPSSLLVQDGTIDPPRESALTQTRPTRIFPSEILPTQVPPPGNSALAQTRPTRIFPSEILPTQEPPPQGSTLAQTRPTRIYPSEILPTQVPPPPPPPPSQSASSTPPLPPPPPSATPASSQTQPPTSQPTQPSDDDDDDGAGGSTESSRKAVTSTSATSRAPPKSSMDAMRIGGGSSGGGGQGAGTSNGTVPYDMDQGIWTMNDGERDCVCNNKSFNVPSVAALCSSCIAKANDLQNDMDVIMNTCRFSAEQYSPDKDKIVNNIQVQATPPKAVLGQNAGVTSGAAASPRPIRGLEVGVAAVLSLLQRWLL
ncbi:hypothetical protein LLEC1_07719 [Akanthomyces lecanii]|uniref:Uncharacterized protein n=1 Tax=Cordyceps confragosa TaxID=2714763 RepID=A0A179IMX4_CORDF|nr:hypothetical protein LLEC1_07719 [Akanthomyces lecanii]